jgi:hypothetical protein
MSQVTISGNAGGTGIFTIASPNSNSNVTLTLPATTGTVLAADGSGNVSVSGTVTATSFSGSGASLTGIPAPSALTTASGSAPSYSARAWVNFNGTGTPAIRASGNVSSITDNGTGDYTANFTTALPDTNYSLVNGTSNAIGDTSNARPRGSCLITASTGSVRFQTRDGSGSISDPDYVSVAVFR